MGKGLDSRNYHLGARLTWSLPAILAMPEAEEVDTFRKAVWTVKNKAAVSMSNSDRLKFYKWYKQGAEGDVKGDQPWAIQVETRLKWDAWNEVKGTSGKEARENYVGAVTDTDPTWADWYEANKPEGDDHLSDFSSFPE